MTIWEPWAATLGAGFIFFLWGLIEQRRECKRRAARAAAGALLATDVQGKPEKEKMK